MKRLGASRLLVIGAALALDTGSHPLSIHSARYMLHLTDILAARHRSLDDTRRPAPARVEAKSPEPIALEDELDWIDRAQRALVSRPAVARAIIDAYRAAVSPRAYDEEATAIAAEASARVGDRDRAMREVVAFEMAFPKSAYADRVRAVESEEGP